MPRYKYKATDELGNSVTSEVEAASETEARQILESRGLRIDDIMATASAASPELTTEESHEVTSRLSQLTDSSLPLASGLRAAADECGSRRVAAAMHQIAARVENGESLEEVVADSSKMFPPHVSGLVLAATKTGKLGAALSELLEHQRSVRSLRRSIRRGFAYPTFVACLAVLVLLFALFGISDTYIRLFDEFGLQLPLSTRLLIWWRDYGVALASSCAAGGVVLAMLLRLVLPSASWSRIVVGVPIIGPLAYWTGLAEWCSLLSVLVKNQIALPQALRLSAAGIKNAYVGRISMELAELAAEGHSLSELLSTSPQLPVSLVPLVRWGERVGLLHEAFGTARELFDRRVKVRALMLQSILPPILFILVACSVGMVIGALFAPLTSMISQLS
ncbi:MAG: type II secretion system F family protein [Planctomycetes bacterium]|nr:type II secretion system F family protein [Planctomycetota bacterium]